MSAIARLRSATALVGVALFAASLALYLSTLAPTLTWGWADTGVDGGELLAAANTFGVPHPPGYPTYTMLLKLFATIVPVGDFAFRGNLMSAVFAAASVAALYVVALRFCLFLKPAAPRWLALASASLGASAFATSPLFWSQAVITEVYTLNALLVGALLVIATHVALPSPDDRPDEVAVRSAKPSLALFGLLLGLGLGNHLTLLAIAVPLLYWMASRAGWRKIASPWLIGPLLAGVAVYAYLPIRAAQHPPINWGNADTIQGMVWMLTARPYQEYVLGVAAGTLLDRALDWIQLVFVQFNALGLFFGLMAVGPLRKTAPRFFYASLASVLVLSVYSITYNTFDFQVLMLPAFLVFSTWLGIGFFWLASTSVRDFAGGAGGVISKWRGRITAAHQATVLSALAFALLPAISLALNYGSQDRSGDRRASENATEIMAAVPDGSVVLSYSEQDVFSLWYMRYVEAPERDVAVIATPLLQFDWYLDDIRRMFPSRVPVIAPNADVGEAMRSIAQHNMGRAPVYTTFLPAALTTRFELERLGRVYQVKAR